MINPNQQPEWALVSEDKVQNARIETYRKEDTLKIKIMLDHMIEESANKINLLLYINLDNRI